MKLTDVENYKPSWFWFVFNYFVWLPFCLLGLLIVGIEGLDRLRTDFMASVCMLLVSACGIHAFVGLYRRNLPKEVERLNA